MADAKRAVQELGALLSVKPHYSERSLPSHYFEWVQKVEKVHADIRDALDRAAPQPAASDVDHDVVRAVAAEREACIKLASEYCWMRYKGRPPANLHSSCVFTSHEWQKIAEAIRAEREKADALATPAPSTSTERSPASDIAASLGHRVASPASTEEALRAVVVRLADWIEGEVGAELPVNDEQDAVIQEARAKTGAA